jgi:Flp pilus assembly protein TadD
MSLPRPSADGPSADDSFGSARAIRREALQLCALVLMAVAAFFVTRALAVSNREMSLRDAAEWYARGQGELSAGQVGQAVDAFRRATVRDRTNKGYALALARALGRDGSRDAARAALLALRESAPEDREVNLELARLAAQDRDVSAAVQFYHSALYAPWDAGQEAARRDVRVELIQFLLASDQRSRAQAELFALSSDLPNDVPHHLQAGQLFARTGDQARALEQFQLALRLEPANEDAVNGAGLAAFSLGDYSQAQRLLHQTSGGSADLRATRELVDLVIASDPWAGRIGSAERRRRLLSDLSYAQTRLQACLARDPAAQSVPDLSALAADAQTFVDQLPSRGYGLEQDTIENGFDVIARIERRMQDSCGPSTPRDRALMLIARQHGGDPR